MPDFSDWTPYVELTTGDAPRPFYLRTVELVDQVGTAVDLGFGAGNEVLDLLQRGWQVHAVDSSTAALAELARRADGLAGLTLERSELWEAQPPAADYVHAGFSLFFAPPERFAEVWAVVTRAVRPGGIFAGQLLGERDTWADEPGLTVHTEAEVRELLAEWDVLELKSVELDGRAMSGPKHWHRFDIVARRI
ncbi:methyltransferase domain-containing protein [Kribbella sp. NBC_01505]|uniref:class I SAM-dependent methyltransferase n=1 Tax=Kribbella sp. NBC_01505 TaxID=2903580 RepID=UPI0038695359